MTELTPCPPGLLEDAGLLVPPDPELQQSGFRASNRQLRMFVCAWMLGGNLRERGALAVAERLYAGAGRDIAAPGNISQSAIEQEVVELVDLLDEALA